LNEPSVTLTDYFLTIECGLFAWWLAGISPAENMLQAYFVGIFIALALAALFGGTVHGFFPAETSLGNRILWPCTMLAVGAAAYCAWGIGSTLLLATATANWIMLAAGILLLIYSVVVLFFFRGFGLAILHYLPAVLFATTAFAILTIQQMQWAPAFGFLGLIGTVIAAGLQARRVAIHPIYFDHNALYHLIQAAALVLVYLSARTIIAA
jgi:hypothetical protein